jgi:MFS family permease
MMVTQAFLYNAIFFTNASVLHNFYNVPPDRVGVLFFPFALGNLAGPLLIGHLFDTVGRRKMIMFTYCASGILLAISALFFLAGSLTAITQTLFWCGDLLPRLGGGLLCVSHRQRDLSARAAGSGHRSVLCRLHAAPEAWLPRSSSAT